MGQALLRIVSAGLARRQPDGGAQAAQAAVTLASALVRADESPELAARLGQFALQFLH